MYLTKSSSPIKNHPHQIDESLNESEILDFSLQEISSGSSKKCSDSDCGLCECENICQNLNGTKINEEKKCKICQRFVNKSSNSGSSDSKNNLSKSINITQEENANIYNTCISRENYNNFSRPFHLENASEIIENDITFWNLYHIAFNSFFQNLPENDLEYHKLAETCALNNSLINKYYSFECFAKITKEI